MGLQIFSTFQHSHYLELAISELKEYKIEDIYAVPLDNRKLDSKMFDTMHAMDGTSLVDTALILAMMCGTVGVARGFVLDWGPVFWGLIGSASGFAAGFAFDVIKTAIKRKKIKTGKTRLGEIIIIVQCKNEQAELVEQTLWRNMALGVAVTSMQSLERNQAVLADKN
ncbi:hypothetical protein [Paenibacillus glycinis]|uniref:Uncharacterized protein n=1 Tax=Paenibacillus glycinis TaxID=2697035 RepID=A0ABW9XQI2_9BACL|nr:hypothetical protein [Paenibacillus glycinis]NBD24901.1 hypothetical protein [Paenibacillus glycinis]